MHDSFRFPRRDILKLPAALWAVSVAGIPFDASSQTARNVFMVVPVPAGGGMDATARLIAENVRDVLGQVIIENKPGAALRVGLYAVRAAVPDGGTLIYTSVSPFTIYPHVYKKLGFDPDGEFVPVAAAVSYDFALGVPGTSSVSTLAEYIEAARKDPERNGLYAVPGAGSSVHFTGAALASATGVNLNHVPYKGSAPAMQDLIGGHVPACVNVLGEFLPYRGTGKVKVLATTGATRSPLMPDVPTFSELGFKGMVLNEQFGIFAPAKTPAAMVNKINAAVVAAVQRPEVVRRLAELGYSTLPISASEFATKLKADRAAWGPIVKSTGFNLDD
ncbi:MAG: Bug family tripartite tricarboxylate transporter substrate binding protein [Rhodoferax sp.]